jgi:hypothetical protein
LQARQRGEVTAEVVGDGSMSAKMVVSVATTA